MKMQLYLILTLLFLTLAKSDFQTNINNLINEDEEEIMRIKSVGCLYVLNLRYDYTKEYIEVTLRQSPHEDKSKITFNLNNDKTLHEQNFYYLIESGEKEEEFLLDMDQSLELDEEEQLIKKFITQSVQFTKNELIPEQPPQIIEQEEFKKIAEEKLQDDIKKLQEENYQQQYQKEKLQKEEEQQEQQIQEQKENQNQLQLFIQSVMQDENFNIYVGLFIGLLTGITYAFLTRKKQNPEQNQKQENQPKAQEKQQEKKKETKQEKPTNEKKQGKGKKNK